MTTTNRWALILQSSRGERSEVTVWTEDVVGFLEIILSSSTLSAAAAAAGTSTNRLSDYRVELFFRKPSSPCFAVLSRLNARTNQVAFQMGSASRSVS